ncbi:MAG: hypothetical protein HQL69_15510 [Magnetococcales bacterium]|nr:hypothetical protein [Magnetococcales bacterium]
MIIIHPSHNEALPVGLVPGVVQLIKQEVFPAIEIDEEDDFDPEEGSYLVIVENMEDFKNQDHQLFYGDLSTMDIYWEYVGYFPELNLFFAQTGSSNLSVGVIIADEAWLGPLRQQLIDQATECAA